MEKDQYNCPESGTSYNREEHEKSLTSAAERYPKKEPVKRNFSFNELVQEFKKSTPHTEDVDTQNR